MDVLSTIWETLVAYSEPLGFATGILCVWLTVKANIWSWPIGNLNAAFLGIVFLEVGLYSDALLQVFFIIMGFYGWWFWLRGGKDRTEAPITRAPRRTLWLTAGLTLIGAAIWGLTLMHVTNSTVPFADAATTMTSLAATYLLARKYLEAWLVWVFLVDLPMIGLYLYKGLGLTALLYVIFTALATKGYFEWRSRLAPVTIEP